ncbi:uncharacterized protein EDB91DRAFT_1085577 [Suillus paluster]|uniref:uncharacterized protein n=1 Tax=Suillus paluster TaxID=48578 RepID=UPI001B85E0F1|nr:uncharacterized protein EDB91DRAFT_1085577 [Suillus paluster]KAG1729944.1 hypothetical protein EDB91DRAFT_1085577 [Suillus paluster]
MEMFVCYTERSSTPDHLKCSHISGTFYDTLFLLGLTLVTLTLVILPPMVRPSCSYLPHLLTTLVPFHLIYQPPCFFSHHSNFQAVGIIKSSSSPRYFVFKMKGNNQVCFECEEVIQVPQGRKVMMNRGQPTCNNCNLWNVRYEKERMEVVWDNHPILKASPILSLNSPLFNIIHQYSTGFPIPPKGSKVTCLLCHIEEDGTQGWKFVTTWVKPETGKVVWDGRVIFNYVAEFPPPSRG